MENLDDYVKIADAARDKIVEQKMARGMKRKDAEEQYGDNPDFYDEFFVPELARWSHLQ